MPTRPVGRPRLRDGRHTRTTGIRISDHTFDRFKELVERNGGGLSMARVLGDLVERYVEENEASETTTLTVVDS